MFCIITHLLAHYSPRPLRLDLTLAQSKPHLNMTSTRSQTMRQSLIDDFTPADEATDTKKKPTPAQLKAANKATTNTTDGKNDSKKRAPAAQMSDTPSPNKRRKTTADPAQEESHADAQGDVKDENAEQHDDNDASKPTDSASSAPKSPKKTKNPPKQASLAPDTSGDIQTTTATSNDEHHSSTTITINRAPVLTLWAACVTEFLYPALSWPTCLSAGASISSLCAISKGRAIGTIDPPSNSNQPDSERAQTDDDEELRVMGFPLHVKNGLVVDSKNAKPKPGNEKNLESKFGEDEEHETREVFRSCLQTWKGEKEQLNKKAFGMYEKFRPDVPKGQKGWGRKGELSLESVENVVRTR